MLSALLFLYREVLVQPLPWLDGLERAKRPARIPTVLTAVEVQRLLGAIQGTQWLMASLLYGAGLRLRMPEASRQGHRLWIRTDPRDGKGAKDRVTMLPASFVEPLRTRLVQAKALHVRDLAAGYGHVELPDALARKYPRAPYEWGRKFAFPRESFSPIREAA